LCQHSQLAHTLCAGAALGAPFLLFVYTTTAINCLQDNSQQINSIDFHRTADLLVTASHDDMIYVYDTAQGTRLATEVPSKKYGAQNVVWTHSTEQVVLASNKVREKVALSAAGDATLIC
jgi:WD40 repeat protein